MSVPVGIPLSSLTPGKVGVVASLGLAAADAAHVRAMGLHEQVRVRLCRAGEPCIVAVLPAMGGCAGEGESSGSSLPCCASRIGLARALAERIWVTPA